MTTPGWYNDERTAGLARWHDGSGWTAHTMVIADWRGPGDPPPPSGAPLTTIDDPTGWSFDGPASDALDEAWDDRRWRDEPWSDDGATPPRHRAPGTPGIDWSRVVVPAGVLGLLLLAVLAIQVLGHDADDTKDLGASETAALNDIDDAVRTARRGLPLEIDVSDGDLKALIRGLCDTADGASTDTVAQDAAMAVSSAEQLTPVLAAAARGAADYCPTATSVGGAVDDVAAAAALRLPEVVTTLPTGTVAVDPAAARSAGPTTKAAATTQPTAAAGSTVRRTETRSQTSTNNTTPPSDVTRGDEEVTGNIGNNHQSVSTVITAPPATTPPSTTPPSTDTTTPSDPP